MVGTTAVRAVILRCSITHHGPHESMSSLKYALESENTRVHHRTVWASHPPALLQASWLNALLGYLLYSSMLKAVANVQKYPPDIPSVLLSYLNKPDRCRCPLCCGETIPVVLLSLHPLQPHRDLVDDPIIQLVSKFGYIMLPDLPFVSPSTIHRRVANSKLSRN